MNSDGVRAVHGDLARILVVDDQVPNLRLLERALAEAGYESVTTTTDPEEALALCFDELPDILLLDLHMPNMDGFEVMSRLVERVPAGEYFPILVLTADATAAVRRKALALGAKDFLTKPLDLTEVLLRIKNLLDARFLHVALQEHNRMLEERVRDRTVKLQRSLEALRKTDEERRMLLSRLVTAQEEERRRIAGDIHDDSVQVVLAAHMRMQLLRRKLNAPEEVHALERLEETLVLSIARLRHLLFELRPPALDREGLAPALRMYLEESFDEEGPAWSVENDFRVEPDVEVRTILYRLAQEALANVRKHARAGSVTVRLQQKHGGFSLQVRDDGMGFDPAVQSEPRPGHLGLTSLRERAELAGGWCRVESAPGAGTSVEFFIPGPADELSPEPQERLRDRGDGSLQVSA